MAPQVNRAYSRRRRRGPSRATIVKRRVGGLIASNALLIAAGFGIASLVGGGSKAAPVVTISLQAPTGTPVVQVSRPLAGGNPVAPGFTGLSIEYTALTPYTGTHGVDPVFVRLIRNLNPGQAPSLRIGGDTTDWSWVPVSGMTKPAGIRYTITPSWLSSIAALTQALGAHVIFGVNLEADNPTLAATEAKAFVNAVGHSSVGALELGNEPEVYGHLGWYTRNGKPVLGRPASYSLTDYTSQFTRFAGGFPSGVPLAGPATGSASWMNGLPAFLAAAPHKAIVTVHRYPLARCFTTPGNPAYPTLAHLLSPAASIGLARSVALAASAAHAHGALFRVDELNSISCRGKRGLSDTFASALWGLDTLFAMASVNVDGVNVHTLPASDYHPFAVTGSGSARTWSVDPLYYGMLMFSLAAPPGSHLLTISGSAARQVRVWATRAPDGRTRVVLINEYSRRTKYVRVAISGAHSPAALTWLRAPSILARHGITLGGQSFGASTSTGRLVGRSQRLDVAAVKGGYVMKLPPASAAMLTVPAAR